jgi:putative phage-type endonuclease
MEYDVTIDRNQYIGGSDIPVIMGISPFKTRYELLLEKAGLRDDDFSGNRYTEYGKVLEPQIRDYINAQMPTGEKFEPNQVINGDIRCHTDGFNGFSVLEIKTTSHIYETLDEYKVYLVQLLLYMQENKVSEGLLVVYKRDDDFNPILNVENLHIYHVIAGEYKTLTDEINAEIERFRADLARLKENPLLSEEDFQPDELVLLSNKAVALEQRMAEYKTLEEQYKKMKQELYEAMQKHGVKTWEMPNGTKITRVDGASAVTETSMEFDVEAFKAENEELYGKYQKTVTKRKSGRAGYVKITMP